MASQGSPSGDLGGYSNNMNASYYHKKPGWLTANKDFYRNYVEKRNELKNSMTPAEKLLREELKSKKLGVKFRRQHVIECFIPDFVSLPLKLIIEVDGKIHLKRKVEDLDRTCQLEMLGYKAIRFKNEDIEMNIDWVLQKIKHEIAN
jgi:very-short-patch-repair endonuclease